MVEFLLEAGLPIESTDDWNTPLGDAVFYGYQDIAALCLQWGADIHAQYNGYPLIYVALKNPPLLKFLQQKGADVFQLNQNGESLLYAVARGLNYRDDMDDVEVFEQLLGMGLNPHIRDYQGRSLLHSAVLYKPLKFIKYLVESIGVLADLRDDEGLTALECLRFRYSADTAEYLEALP